MIAIRKCPQSQMEPAFLLPGRSFSSWTGETSWQNRLQLRDALTRDSGHWGGFWSTVSKRMLSLILELSTKQSSFSWQPYPGILATHPPCRGEVRKIWLPLSLGQCSTDQLGTAANGTLPLLWFLPLDMDGMSNFKELYWHIF